MSPYRQVMAEQDFTRRVSLGGRQRLNWRVMAEVVDGRVRMFCAERTCKCLGHDLGDGDDPDRELIGEAFTVSGLVHAIAIHRAEWRS